MPRAYLKKGSFWLEVILRLVLGGLFIYMECLPPFERYISPADLETAYKHPRRDSYVPARVMWSVVLLVPPFFFIHSLVRKDRYDFVKALAALSLALVINGIITDSVKLIVGRPRPDFFWRCFPDGVVVPDMRCTGNLTDITDGRKSFPSGHSSFSFCSLGFLSFWLQGRLGVWCARGRGSGLRLVASLAPLGAALGIALSRTCDYHHHWQDVLAGSLLGLGVAYMCYSQNYHPLSSSQSGEPYGSWLSSPGSAAPGAAASASNGLVSDRTPLLVSDRRETKWI